MFECVGLEHILPPKANSWLVLGDCKAVAKKSKTALIYLDIDADEDNTTVL